jgi:hypothetical protein
MMERDLAWSLPLFREYEYNASLADFIIWAGQPGQSAYSGVVRENAAYILCWFFTTSHRALRDKATKALVFLFVDHLEIAAQLLRDFAGLNDDYLLERVCAAAYGAMLRSRNPDGMDDLARAAHQAAFRPTVHPHLGVRFYAGQVVEAVSAHVPAASSLLTDARPPFPRRSWPDLLPSSSFEHRFTMPNGRRDPIWASINGSTGDFGLYVIGTNQWRFPFGHHAHGRLSPDEVMAAVLAEILQLGWTPDSGVARFDASLSYSGRAAHKPERLGKKYQWIAWRRIQALAMDSLVPVVEPYDKPRSHTDDRWLRDAVDIDPSLHLQRNDHTDHSTWWSPVDEDLAPDVDDANWLMPSRPLPEVRQMIEVRDVNGMSWLALHFSRLWGTIYPDEQGARRLWIGGRCYLVKRPVAQRAEEWANAREGWGWASWSSALEPTDGWSKHVMFREYWSSPAFFQSHPNVQLDDDSPPVPMVSTGRRYVCEGNSLDLSVDTTIALWLPHEAIVHELGLSHGSMDGDYVNQEGEVVMRDPTAREAGPSCLLLRADAAHQLRERGYDLLWLVLAEKITPSYGRNRPPGYATFAGSIRATGAGKTPQWVDNISPPRTMAGIIRAAAAPSRRGLPVEERSPLLTAKGLGVPAGAMAAAESQGVIERVVPGVYMGATAERTGLTEAAGWVLRHPQAVVALMTAAAHYHLIDAYPGGTWLLVPKGTSPPRSETAPVEVVQTTRFIDPDDDGNNGIDALRRHGLTIRITSPDRTTLDLWRYARRISRENAMMALRRRVTAKDFDLPAFRRLAMRIGVWKKVGLIVEGMVAT